MFEFGRLVPALQCRPAWLAPFTGAPWLTSATITFGSYASHMSMNKEDTKTNAFLSTGEMLFLSRD